MFGRSSQHLAANQQLAISNQHLATTLQLTPLLFCLLQSEITGSATLFDGRYDANECDSTNFFPAQHADGAFGKVWLNANC
jgi:hypothetical protein